mgnify:FL=1
MKFRKLPNGVKIKRPVKTALVLSGGGAKGAYQVGVIGELLKRGIKFDLVTGSSIGAFNSALLAEFSKDQDQIDPGQKLQEIWLNLDKFLPLNWAGWTKNITTPHKIPSIFSNKNIKAILKEYIGAGRSFSDYMECQLSVTGTNLDRKTKKVFDFNSEVEVIKAVLASMAYPVGLPTVDIFGNKYVDGGVLDNAPLKEAILWGARKIYVIFLTPLSVIETEDKNLMKKEDESYPAWRVIDELIDLASNNMMYGDMKRAQKINQLLKLIDLYEGELPDSFLSQLYKIFGLRKGEGKRIVNITKIAPQKVLNPPGTMGFDNKKVIGNLIAKGKRDAIIQLGNT